MGEKKIYYSIDTFKCVAAFFVVCLHVPLFKNTPYSIIGEYLIAIARVGVPFFFMVSGFFSYTDKKPTKQKNKKQLKKIGKHILIMLGIDFIYVLSYLLIGNSNIFGVLEKLKSVNFIFFNFSIASHMWFMRALIYLEIIVLVITNLPIRRLLERIGPFILLGIWLYDILLLKYSVLIGVKPINNPLREIVTKFICTGLLYFFIGWMFRRYQDKIISFWERKKALSVTVIIFSFVMTVLECDMLIERDANVSPVNYFFTIVTVLSVFAFLITFQEFGKGSISCFIGAKLSMYIYYWHLLVKMIILALFKGVVVPITNLANPFVVFAVSIVLALIIYGGKLWENKTKSKKLAVQRN